jgi:glyoxylase-like metal-dependent hydrolase (beta-lactamase superfamily II)
VAQKTFITSLPDKAGVFLQASRLISGRGGNIRRVSYNKAVDPHTVFIDVEADEEALDGIENDLKSVGYVRQNIAETKVIEINVRIPDHPGAVLPVLEILNRHDINICYMNSCARGDPWQDFKFALLIEDPPMIKTILTEISAVYPVDIIESDSSEEELDNTVFYIHLANEMKSLLGISDGRAMEFIRESNRILQFLQSKGEDADKVFDYIRRFARTVSGYRGSNYKIDREVRELSPAVTLYSIQPYCGSNTYLLDCGGELVIIDTGYSIYREELTYLLVLLFPDWHEKHKRVYITHADVDHCGLLHFVKNAGIFVNEKSFENFRRQLEGLPDFREQTELHHGYSKISRIISGYVSPQLSSLTVIDKGTPLHHDSLVPIGSMKAGGLDFTIYEGSGGHLSGEMVFVNEKPGVVFTGDILVNIDGFSEERAEFNSLAPYLMKSVNEDSKKAAAMRKEVTEMIQAIAARNGKPCLVCGGHGPLFTLP